MERKKTMLKTTLYVVRHGESEGNVNGDITGTNPPLTKRGLAQAEELSNVFKSRSLHVIYSSPLIRAHHTALSVAKKHGLPVSTSSSIKERFFGSLEGKKRQEVRDLYKDKYELFNSATPEEQLQWKVVEDMESFMEVYKRVEHFFDEVFALHQGKSILLVTHAHVMLSLLINLGFATFNELPFGAIRNTGYMTIEKENKKYKITSVYGITKKSHK